MKKINLTKTSIALSISALLTTSAFANNEETNTDDTNFFGNVRIGYINADAEDSNKLDSSAVGVKLGFISANWHGLSVGGTLYSSQKLLNDDNGDFFASDGSSYAILGEGFIQGDFANTQLKIGRFEFDSPHIDTDDIRMVPNTFSGALLTNTDITDTTLYLMHLDKWAGVDSETPEKFTNMNGDDGITAVGAEYQGVENIAMQAWYYHGSNLANIFYIDAIYEMGDLTLGAQYGNQSDSSSDTSGPDGDVYGVMASYVLADFTLNAAINKVSGTVTNGFGGGPFFTSAQDHTIDGVENQSAVAAGIDYSGIENLTLSLLHVAFNEGADETDFVVNYNFGNDMTLDVIYHDMNEDGKMLLAMFNMAF